MAVTTKKKYSVHEPEKAIQRRILDWLERTELLHWRANAGWAFVGPRMIRLGPDGMPDVVVVVGPAGRFIGLEVKSATGTLRPAQREFGDKIVNAGGMYTVVRSLEDAQNAVAHALGEEQWNVLQRSLKPEKQSKRSRSRPLKQRASSRSPKGSTTLTLSQTTESSSSRPRRTASKSRSGE